MFDDTNAVKPVVPEENERDKSCNKVYEIYNNTYQKSLPTIYLSSCGSATNLAMSDRQDLSDSSHQHQSIPHHIFQEIEGS